MDAAVRVLGLAVSAGLCGGSLLGALEALYVLQSTTPAEYQAFGYGWTLYGLVGGITGSILGVLLLPVGRRLDAAWTWCLVFAAVLFPLSFALVHHLLDRLVYDEGGVPVEVSAALAGCMLVVAAMGVWIGANLLTKTPLRALTTARGAVAAWGGGLVLAWIFALSPAPAAPGEPPTGRAPALVDRPDIVFVVIDSLRADALGAYGAPSTATPALDAFARDSLVFEETIAAAAWTRPAMASLFTSVAPSTHRCARPEDVLSPDVTTLAEALSERGYVTLGLPDSASVSAAQGFGQGFSAYPYDPDFPAGAAESTHSLSLYRAFLELHARLDAHQRVERYYEPAETQLGRARALLQAHHDERTFLFVHLMEPHEPWFDHPYDGRSYSRSDHAFPSAAEVAELHRRYAAEVQHADEELGKFFQALREDGRYNGALIVVTGDHGEELGDSGVFWHGTTLRDEAIRVPLLVKLPGNTRGGTRVPWQVRSVDIAPTLVDAAGALPPSAWQGVELFPDSFDADLALSSPPPGDEPLPGWRAPDWSTHPASRDALVEEDLEGYRLQAIRRGGRKLVEALRVPAGNPRNMPAVGWYDLKADPREERNLAGSGTGDEAAYKAALESLVEDRRRKAPGQPEVDPEERCRLCALGYGAEADCADCPKAGR